MRVRFIALLLAAALCGSLAGCGQQKNSTTLSVCVGEGVSTLDPIYAQDSASQTVLAHLYENLMRVAAEGTEATVVNGMAKSVETEENLDGTVTYTFQLRTARWSDGEKVTAEDFVYAWRRLADPASHSPNAALLSVVSGYQEARRAKDMSLLQVSARNDTTLEVTLNGNYDWFLREVCTSPMTVPLRQDVVQRLKETAAGEEGTSWWGVPSALVTNGPYVAGEYAPGSHLTLTANERYQSSQAGPETLTFQFAATAEEAQALYDQGLVDAVWPLTEERLTQLASQEEWTPLSQLETYAVVYNCSHELLADGLIRKALAMTVDRVELAELAGVTALPAEGLVPPGVPENEEGDFRTRGGALLDNDTETFLERCQQAREALNEAGYSGGAELGELEYLYVEDGVSGAVAQALSRRWQDLLGVTVTPRAVADRQELWAALRSGEYALAGVELDAWGNDAECFLMSWTSDSQDNVADYENSAYDTLMSIIAHAADGTARMGCLHDAEALLLEDCALTPLYTKGTAWTLRETLTGACRDGRGWFNFSNTIAKTN